MLTRISRRTLSILSAAVVAVIGLTSVWLHAAPAADPSPLVPYTGYLQLNGVPQNGAVQLGVALYDPTVGTPIWQDQYAAVSVTNGRFNITLGINAAAPLDPGYFNGSKGSGQLLQLEVAVNGTTLSPRQTLYAAPYAIASGTANHSPADFNVNGSVTLTNTNSRAITFTAPGDAINGVSYRPAGATDALSIAGAGTSIGQRLLRLFDNVVVAGTIASSGAISAGGDVSTSGRFVPAYDSGFFYVHSNPSDGIPPLIASPTPGAIYHLSNGDIGLYHNLNFIPSQIMIQSCGTTDGTTCATVVVLNGATGYHDSGSSLNPSITSADANHIYLSMVPSWWAFGVSNSTSWTCGVAGASCYQALYRVLLWR